MIWNLFWFFLIPVKLYIVYIMLIWIYRFFLGGIIMSEFKNWVYDGTVEDEYQTEYKDGIMVGKPVCAMVNVYDAVKKASDKIL